LVGLSAGLLTYDVTGKFCEIFEGVGIWTGNKLFSLSGVISFCIQEFYF